MLEGSHPQKRFVDLATSETFLVGYIDFKQRQISRKTPDEGDQSGIDDFRIQLLMNLRAEVDRR